MWPQEPLLATVKRRKLAWFGHLTRHNCLAKTILQGTLEGGRKQGRQRKSWTDNIKEWTSLTTPELLRTATDREEWRRVAAKTSLKSPLRPARPRDERVKRVKAFHVSIELISLDVTYPIRA